MTNGNESQLSAMNRRRLIQLLGAGGVAGLAGCQGGSDGTPTGADQGTGTETDEPLPGDGSDGDGDSTPTGTPVAPADEIPHVEGQEFVLPTDDSSGDAFQNVTFFHGFNEDRFLESSTDLTPFWDGRELMNGYGLQANWFWEQGGDWLMAPSEETPVWLDYGLHEGDDVDDQFFDADAAWYFEILDPSDEHEGWDGPPVWSDGQPMRALDLVPQQLYSRFAQGPPYDNEDLAVDKPSQSFGEILFPEGRDGNIVQFTDPFGAIENVGLKWMVRKQLLTGGGVASGISPSHLEPWAGAVENGLEWIQELAQNPTTDHNREIFVKEHTSLSVDHFEAWRDPDTVVSYGPWALQEIRGTTDILFEPNPEWPGPGPNFDTVRIPSISGQERMLAEFQAGRLDYLEQNLAPELQDQVPDKYESYTYGGQSNGYGVGWKANERPFDTRNVRAAFMYALDKATISELLHPDLTSPITVPAGDVYGRASVDALSDEWVENNLIDYSYDVDRADELMQMEGYSRQGGQWVDPDGENVSLVLPTTSGTPSFEEAIVSQWRDWGVEINIQTMDEANFESDFNNTQFRLWSETPNSGVLGGGTNHRFYTDPYNYQNLITNHATIRQTGLFDESKVEELIADYPSENISGQDDVFRENDATMEVPVIGSSNPADPSETMTLNPVAETMAWKKTNPEDKRQDDDFWRTYYWLYNWQLPTLPVISQSSQMWINEENWDLSKAKNHYMWDYLGHTTIADRMLMWGDWIRADPDNPKEGASVE